MSFADYEKYDAVGLAELVRGGQVKPLDLVEAAIERIEERNPALNAVVHKLYDDAREAAPASQPDGPLAGVPFLLKDLLAAFAGTPTTSSCRFEQNYVPQYDSELVARYRKAGLIVVGRTNTPEYGLKTVTESVLRGPARNPWNTDHTPGGSSGGSAASVAARIVPAAHGGDGGGSIRIPASCCGLFGMKPTRGRTPAGPDVGEGWNGYAIEHAITRSVRDNAALLDATQGAAPGDPYAAPPVERPYLEEVQRDPGKLRIAYTRKNLFGQSVHADCLAALDEAIKQVADLGHTVEEVELPYDKERAVRGFLYVIAGSMAQTIEDAGRRLGKTPTSADFEPATWLFNIIGRKLSAFDLEDARCAGFETSRSIGRFMKDYDAIMTPTMTAPPTRIGELDPKPMESLLLKVMMAVPIRSLLKSGLDAIANSVYEATGNTMLFNVTGQPAMSVPLCWNSAGLPIGIQFAGRFGDEATLFRLAGQLEKAYPWADKRP